MGFVARLNITISSYKLWDDCYKDKTVLHPSDLYNDNPHTCKKKYSSPDLTKLNQYTDLIEDIWVVFHKYFVENKHIITALDCS